MARVARITVLADNSVYGRGLLAEHGLAFWIELEGRRLLFDTGQGLALLHNAQHLGVPLELAEAVVLSHGHYDHAGGVAAVLQAAPQARIYAHPAAFEPKYGRSGDGTVHDLGMPSACVNAVRERSGAITETVRPTELLPGLFATGEVPRRTAYEDTGGPFFADPECQRADPLADDQALFFNSRGGTVVLLGCAHAGVVNTLRYVHDLTNGSRIHAVLGGMHLVSASRERMDRTIEDLRRLDVERLGPMHCTGVSATAGLWSAFPGTCLSCAAGAQLDFELERTGGGR